MELRFCGDCGFVANARFDQGLSEYSARYEETQGFSARFNDFARDLAKRWVEKYSLAGRTVLEIGCGKGEFLEMMCEAGVQRASGSTRAHTPSVSTARAASRIEWITDFYSESYYTFRPMRLSVGTHWNTSRRWAISCEWCVPESGTGSTRSFCSNCPM
ncbi:MAG: hypothetical protein R2789_04990 [Microthrixaceae bacterium]